MRRSNNALQNIASYPCDVYDHERMYSPSENYQKASRIFKPFLQKRVRRVLRPVISILEKRFPPKSKPLPRLEDYPNSPDLFDAYHSYSNSSALTRSKGGWNYKGKFYPDYLTVGGASHAIIRVAKKFCKGKGIDVGAAYWPLPGAIPVDIARGEGNHRTIEDFSDASLDYVFSSHCLEHISDWKSELKKWADKVRKGGILFLYLPHPDCKIWEPGSPMVGTGHKWAPSLKVVKAEMTNLEFEPISEDPGPDAMQSFFVVGKKLKV